MGRVLLVGMIATALMLCVAGCGAAGGISPMTSEQAATSAPPASRVSFVAPLGSGDGQICYVHDPCGTWGPTGFCVLPDKSVAILDCGDTSIHVFSHAGESLYSIDLTGIGSSLVDIRWWNEAFAVLEFNTEPKSVILVGADGKVRGTIDLWPGMDETMEGGLRIGRDGELGLIEPCGPIHVLTDPRGDSLSPAQMRQTTSTYAFRGGPEFEVGYQQEGPARVRAVGSSDWLPVGPDDTGGGTPLASDDLGNTYFKVARVMFDSSGESVVGGDYVVVKLDKTFRQVGYARIDWTGLVVSPIRTIDVTSDGNAYAMRPMADGVHIETLEFSAELPELEAPR